MSPSTAPPPAARNRLLAALPSEVLLDFQPQLRPVELGLREVLHRPGEPIIAVYFPESGYASMLVHLEDGAASEVGIIGRDGMVGLAVLLGDEGDEIEAMVQAPGTALRMEAGAFRAALERHPDFRTLLLRYALVHHGQVARTAACNGHHLIEQRLARWLLIAHDRAEGDAFPMTHDFLSHMLGVRRPGVTQAAGAFQKAGLIRYSKGRVEITDRPGLEGVSCECYAVVRGASDRLFAPAPKLQALRCG